jgi:NAD(P)-dependent dehydrogenase (short-subunit alcohol dehydrogenase family)
MRAPSHDHEERTTMTPRLAGKKALITGAAQGLGATIARMMVDAGAVVTVTDRNADGVNAVAATLNAGRETPVAFAFAHDVTDLKRWDEVVPQANAAMGGLSVLVNNAGIVAMGSVESISLDDWHRSMSINCDSVFYGCRASLKFMRDHQPGSIINISSISGLVADGNLSAYNASKAAVWLLTKSVALHCTREKLDIRCNSIHPAFVKTAILAGLAPTRTQAEIEERLVKQVPLGRLGEPEDVGYAAIYLASDESRFMTASEIKLDGGLSAR